MNKKNEEKLLNELIKIIDEPDKVETKFISYTKITMLTSILIIFFCFSHNIDLIENKYIFTLLIFASGAAFGLSIWFLQAGTQTKIMVKHLSKESIRKRIDEINT